jgi:hypothetical protein
VKERRFELGAPDLSRWRAGNTGIEGVWRFESGRPGREVLVSALIHGNELCGAWALAELLASGLRPRAGALTLMFANLEAFDRFDPARPDENRFVDLDMNRLWGDMPWRRGDPAGWACEQRRVAALAPLVERSEWLLDLHSMHEAGEAVGLVGPLAHHARQAARLGMPALLVADAGHRAGCRMRDHAGYGSATETQRFALLVECGFHGDPASLVVARQVLGRFLQHSGVCAPDDLPGGGEPPSRPPRLLEVTQAVPVGPGERPRFARAWTHGERVPAAGTLIGWSGGQEVRSPYDDCVLIMPTLIHASEGATLLRFARELASRA